MGHEGTASAHDVAAYILRATGRLTTMKLQKLVYYAQAWSLVWDDRPLFEEPIQAWANGPVLPDLYARHRGEYFVEKWRMGDPDRLDEQARETVDAVLKHYADRTGYELSQLTHAERPWKDAREGLQPGDRGDTLIKLSSMAEFYGGLVGAGAD